MCDVTVEPKGKSIPITCGPDTLGPDSMPAATEDPVTKDQDRRVEMMKAIGKCLEDVLFDVQLASEKLAAPGMLRDSACVRFFSLFSQLRDQVKQIDAAIGAEIDTESMAKDRKHDVGRLQDMVQKYLERMEAKSASAEGKLVTLTRKMWASAVDIAALKKHKVTSVFVKETVNTNTLTAWVKELGMDDQGQPKIPKKLKDAIKVTDKYGVSARKA